jgi:hypothetical protein
VYLRTPTVAPSAAPDPHENRDHHPVGGLTALRFSRPTATPSATANHAAEPSLTAIQQPLPSARRRYSPPSPSSSTPTSSDPTASTWPRPAFPQPPNTSATAGSARAATLRRHVHEIDEAMDNLVRQLEKETDSKGTLHKRISKRMNELDQELADAQDQLAKHEAAKPPSRQAARACRRRHAAGLPTAPSRRPQPPGHRTATPFPRCLPNRDPLRPQPSASHAKGNHQRRHP